MAQEEVLALASQYLRKVRRVGNDNISGLCPFHMKPDGSEERHPSFSMSLSTGLWHCWSCSAAGRFQDFLRDIGLPRSVVVGQYGDLCKSLRSHSPPAFNPLKPRVIAPDPLSEGILGVLERCPVAMVDQDMALNLDPDDPIVFDESLLQSLDIGFDEKHLRITFPLRDLEGNLVGISGRTVAGAYPRYKVYDEEYVALGYPATAPAKKGTLLWNAHRVYPRVFFSNHEQFVLVVEGFRGCLWALQAGVKNTVALLGSHLSDDQKWILERMGARVYLMLDNDRAGREALEGKVDRVTGKKWPGMAEELSKSLQVSIVTYEGKQPTRLTQEALCRAVNNATDYYSWVVNKSKESEHGVR